MARLLVYSAGSGLRAWPSTLIFCMGLRFKALGFLYLHGLLHCLRFLRHQRAWLRRSNRTAAGSAAFLALLGCGPKSIIHECPVGRSSRRAIQVTMSVAASARLNVGLHSLIPWGSSCWPPA